MESKGKQITAICVHFAVVIMEIIAISVSWNKQGIHMFVYFTELSNIFGALVCLVYGCFLISQLRNGKAVPEYMKILRFVSAGALALTFFTVIFVLAPIAGSKPDYTMAESYIAYLTHDSMIVTHTLGPLSVIFSFLFLDNFETDRFKKVFFGIIPTVLYVIVSVTMNVLRIWVGPYPFLHVYEQPVWVSIMWLFVMTGFSFFLCFCLWALKKQINKKKR